MWRSFGRGENRKGASWDELAPSFILYFYYINLQRVIGTFLEVYLGRVSNGLRGTGGFGGLTRIARKGDTAEAVPFPRKVNIEIKVKARTKSKASDRSVRPTQSKSSHVGGGASVDAAVGDLPSYTVFPIAFLKALDKFVALPTPRACESHKLAVTNPRPGRCVCCAD
jgi:hypothetical protein